MEEQATGCVEHPFKQSFKKIEQQTSSMLMGNFSVPSAVRDQIVDVQHITEPIHLDPIEVVKEVVSYLLAKTERRIDIQSNAALLAIQHTLNALVNDPNLGIIDSKQSIPEHHKSALHLDTEPRTKAFIDSGMGHAKLQAITRQSSKITNSPTHLPSARKWVKRNKNLTTLPSAKSQISPPIQTVNQKHLQPVPLIEQNESRLKSIPLSCCQSLKSLNQPNFVDKSALGSSSDKSQNDTHYINFLRHVKADENNKVSLHAPTRSINSEAIQKSPLVPKNILNNTQNIQKRVNFIQKKEAVGSKIIPIEFVQYGGENGTLDQFRSQNRVRKKKTMKALNLETSVSVKQGQTKTNSFTSFTQNELTKGVKGKNESEKEQISFPTLSLKRQYLPHCICSKEKEIWKSQKHSVLQFQNRINLHYKSYVVLPSINIRQLTVKDVEPYYTNQNQTQYGKAESYQKSKSKKLNSYQMDDENF